MNILKTLVFGGLFLGLAACSNDQLPTFDPLDQELKQRITALSPMGDADYFMQPDDGDYRSLPQDPKNPLTAEKVALGRMLFFETGFGMAARHEAGMGTFSCASCHVPENAFTPGRLQGIADGGAGFGVQGEIRTIMTPYAPEELDVQGVRPLSMLNGAFTTNTQWNGQMGATDVNVGTQDRWNETDLTIFNNQGFEGIEAQARAGLDVHRMVINPEIIINLNYAQYFDLAFPDTPFGARYTKTTTALALAAYIRSLLPNGAPFQQWLRGDLKAMTDLQKEGALVFFNKAKCYQCHTGPGLSNTEFFALGVNDLYELDGAFATDINDKKNKGRGGFTGKEEDLYKFKVPQLYNLKDYSHYFHGSSKTSLREVVEYFNNGVPENNHIPEEQIAVQLTPLDLTEAEMQALEAFLDDGLYDPNIVRYAPDVLPSGNCFPNSDPQSSADLNCL